MYQPTIEDLCWLVQDADDVLRDVANTQDSALRVLSRLRTELTPARATLAVEQGELRRRAQNKFSRAGELFFTAKGYEQATSEHLAAYKAARYPADIAVADLCCGIGGDLMALAARGSVTGFDLDPHVAVLANANLRRCGYDSVPVVVEDIHACNLQEYTAWHLDPDRRPTGNRRSQPDLYEPALSTFLQRRDLPNAGAIKLAPAADWNAIDIVSGAVTPASQSPGQAEILAANSVEREWIGEGRECKQQVVWLGQLAKHPGKRVATLVRRRRFNTPMDGSDPETNHDNLRITCNNTCSQTSSGANANIAPHSRSDASSAHWQFVPADSPHGLTAPLKLEFCQFVGDERGELPSRFCAEVGAYLYEPHACVLAAHLETEMARRWSLARVALETAYFTGDDFVQHPLLDAFHVLAVMPYRVKTITAWLRDQDSRITEVKKRGVDLDPPHVLRALSTGGTRSVTLLLWRTQRTVTAAIATRQ